MTCCQHASDRTHLALFGLQVPEMLLVHDVLDLEIMHSNIDQQSLMPQERNYDPIRQLKRMLVLLPVRSCAATTRFVSTF